MKIKNALMSDVEISVETLPVESLQIDEAYQRFIIATHVKKMSDNLFPEAFGTLIVGRRLDGSVWVVDGFQRLSALKQRGVEEALCYIFESGGRQHEAKAFEVVNCNRRGVSALKRFHAICVAGDKSANDLKAVANELGFVIPTTNTKGWPRLSSIYSLRSLQNAEGTNAVQWVLEAIHMAFDNRITSRNDAIKNDFLGAVCEFRKRWPSADQKRLVKIMKALNVADFLVGHKAPSSGSRFSYRACCLAVIYNKGLRTNRLITPFDDV